MGSAHGKLRKLQFKHFTVSPITVMPWVQHIFPQSCHEATDWQMMIIFGDHVVQSAKNLALTSTVCYDMLLPVYK